MPGADAAQGSDLCSFPKELNFLYFKMNLFQNRAATNILREARRSGELAVFARDLYSGSKNIL